MREILFRGKRVDNGEWVYGSYVYQYGCHEILLESCEGEFGFDHYHVNPETVGQYIGLKDKNGVAIFEGDIVRIESKTFEMIGRVGFEQGCFQLIDPECDMYECFWYQPEEMIVLGNIYENPELLKG